MKVLSIALGGFLGAIARFQMGEWLHTDNGFPVGTLAVNLIGCLALGWFTAFAKEKGIRAEYSLLISTGFIGSFTTFSTFSVETINLLVTGQFLLAFAYVLVTIFVGLFLAYAGFKLAVRGGHAK